MHFVTLVPLSLGIGFVVLMAIFKGLFLLAIAIIALIAWVIYELFFRKEKAEEKESEQEQEEELEEWEKYLIQQEKNDIEFYKKMGRLEQKLDDIEESAGLNKRRRKKK